MVRGDHRDSGFVVGRWLSLGNYPASLLRCGALGSLRRRGHSFGDAGVGISAFCPDYFPAIFCGDPFGLSLGLGREDSIPLFHSWALSPLAGGVGVLGVGNSGGLSGCVRARRGARGLSVQLFTRNVTSVFYHRTASFADANNL